MAEIIHESQWDDFQDLRGFYWSYYKPEIVTDPVREGTHAIRCYVKWPNSKNWPRCELAFGYNGMPEGERTIQVLEYGKRYLFEISVFVPDDLPVVNEGLNDVVFQIHGKPDNGEIWRNPNFAISVKGDGKNWRIHTRGDNRRIQDKNYQFQKAFNTPLAKGKWTDWKIEILLSYNDDGELYIWKDGTSIYSGKHKNCFNDVVGPHCGTGVYVWWFDSGNYDVHREYWIDSIRITDLDTKPEPEHDHSEILGRLDKLETGQSEMTNDLLTIGRRVADIAQLQVEQEVRIKRVDDLLIHIGIDIKNTLGE